MKIVVCIKQVPDTRPQIDIDPAGKNIVEDGMIYIVNPDDRCAVEAAVSLKQQIGGEVTLITLGNNEAEEALRSCLAMGADKALILQDKAFDGGDSSATAKALAQAIGKMDYDLILTGSHSLDGDHGQVPGAIAEMLGLPFVSGVTSLEKVTGQKITVHRKLERGDREVVESILPSVIGVAEGINYPRYASLPDLISAMRQKIEIINASDLGLTSGELGPNGSLTKTYNFTPPRPRPKKIFAPDSNLSAADRMKQMMSGGASKKKSGDLLQGEPEQVAAQIIQFLKDEKII
ncbi:MAG: electron transfer flavoprotein subunit beta/FixA family protein [Syntrophomonadaceae bacterium]|jgi:electron transfer flavoprotein beta subunit|nr:electron transfer flavoprotein subunit beta/FixA family protein [Syntrophomonadaceae bacterium]